MQYFKTEEEFWIAFHQLKALCSEVWNWESHKAQKKHDDMFGEVIKDGDTYFRKRCGPSFSHDLKVSRRSMEKLLYCTVGMSPAIQELGNLHIKKQQEALHAAPEALESE